MVRALHGAGLEVILDVVYNHTAEGNHLGPMLSFQGHRQRGILPARRRRSALLHGLHRHRQQPEHAPPARAAADHGLAALLGDWRCTSTASASTSRRRWRASSRRRPAVGVLRSRPAGSGRQPGEAHRRARGTSATAAIRSATSRRCGPSGTASTATRCAISGAASRRRWREFASRLTGSSDLYATTGRRPLRQHQLRHRARRLHAARPGLVQREAQRGERRGEPRRRDRTTARGTAAPKGRSDDPDVQRAARPPDAQLPRHAAAARRACRCWSRGDELGRTQRGNNNAYCQDNELSWVRLGARRPRAARVRAPADPRCAASIRSSAVAAGSRAGRCAAPMWPTSPGSRPTANEMADQHWQEGFAKSLAAVSQRQGDLTAATRRGAGDRRRQLRRCCSTPITRHVTFTLPSRQLRQPLDRGRRQQRREPQ